MSITISGSGAITGASTSYSFDQAVSIAGTVTYEDVTNVDSVGVITGRNGMHITSGSVGIGTDAPQSPLHIQGSADILVEIESTDQFSHIELKDNSSAARITNDGATGTLRLRADKDNAVSNSNILFEIDGSEKARIKSDGNVGIGTDNPRRPLHLDNTSTASFLLSGTAPQVRFNSSASDSSDADRVIVGRATANDHFVSGAVDGDAVLRCATSKKVLIGYGTTEIAQFNSSGLKFKTSGMGIDFSATGNGGGTMDSELLDDYEEGQWTPDLQFGGAKVGVTYNNQYGRYVKIGRLVHVFGRINLSSKGSSGGNARFFGLPYVTETITGTTMNIGSIWYSGFSLQGSIVQVVMRTDGNGNSFIEPKGVTTDTEDAIGDSDFTNSTDMCFSVTYRTT